jgi:hypothetical protein
MCSSYFISRSPLGISSIKQIRSNTSNLPRKGDIPSKPRPRCREIRLARAWPRRPGQQLPPQPRRSRPGPGPLYPPAGPALARRPDDRGPRIHLPQARHLEQPAELKHGPVDTT